MSRRPWSQHGSRLLRLGPSGLPFEPPPKVGSRRSAAFAALGCLVGASLFFLLPSRAAEPELPADGPTHSTILVLVGAPGEEEYGKQFAQWARQWEAAAKKAQAQAILVGLDTPPRTNDLEHFKAILRQQPKDPPHELWLVLLGHGTFDGREAKFNLRGPDLSATELAALLEPFHRPIALIDASSSSAPFLKSLSAPGRVVITATRSGYEQNFARFGQFISAAIADPQADLDKDGQTSLLEAFLIASRRTAEWYDTEGRLASEHALLDDNGDGLGTPADWFRGVRAIKQAADGAALDGLRAHQFHLLRSAREQELPPAARARRDELELAVGKLRESKPQLGEEEYYRRLEALLLELARLYQNSQTPAVD